MILTHCPFDPAPGTPDWDPTSKGSLSYKGDPKNFPGMVAHMDKVVGRITAKLDELGIRENTLLLFTGDNGTDKPIVSRCNGRDVAGGKGSMTDAGTRVTLIASWPGTIGEGVISRNLVDFSDFLPTICEATGVAVPSKLKIDGRSFLPTLKGDETDPREWIYCWYSPTGGPKGKEWARNQQYKLYRTGRFFDIAADPLEKSPLPTQDLTENAKQTRAMLQNALSTFENARPANLTKRKEGKGQRL